MKYFAFVIVLVTFFSCKPIAESENCDHLVILSQQKYNNLSSGDFKILDATISEHCINITIESGGCDGEDWKLSLIDSEAIKESNPVQKDFKLILNNQEPCRALVRKSFSFDLSPSKIGDDFYINLDSWGASLFYEE